MVSKEASKCLLTNSDTEVEASASLALEMKYSLDPNRQIRKRNKALQVRFKDICDAQNEQRELARQSERKGTKPISCKVAYRKYMTVPARRSIPNVTKSTGVQTSPDLKKRYQTFPFERKKGHSIKNASVVESFKSHNNGFVIDIKGNKGKVSSGEAAQCSKKISDQKEAVLTSHTNDCLDAVDKNSSGNCSDGKTCTNALLHSYSEDTPCFSNPTDSNLKEPVYQLCNIKSKLHRGASQGNQDSNQSAHTQTLNSEQASIEQATETAHRVTGPIAWNSLTQVECLESPSAGKKHKKALQLNGLHSQPLSSQVCSIQAQGQSSQCNEQSLQTHASPAVETQSCQGARAASETCQQIVPLAQDGDLKAQLHVMENLISSSQETIKVLLGVIQELEKGEAHREGLSYRTGQDTANCDTCRNSACIIYSVELDFKQQEDKLQPVLKKLCPFEETQVPSLPYPQEGFASTPKRKSKTESKKHARWKLWFL
ncbi:inhibitory synaptic factor 2A-like [Acipenser ruthenus]|uniref:inhibitory synaptic factor 2A-like n=1 Tax=Acipenser ruthenus TaxID=7906 RepID=UPI001560DDCE|nr:inhibitory synaptic factor 2A-like [Acipenser ruthenus]